MANTYSDATAVLMFDGPAKITPAIQLLFKPFNLDETAETTSTEFYVACLAEINGYTWWEYLEAIVEDAPALGDLSTASDIEVLAALGTAYASDPAAFRAWLDASWRIDSDDSVDLEDVVELARHLDDGHNLIGLRLQGAWHSDKPRLWAFGGWASFTSDRYALGLNTNEIAEFAMRMDKALRDSTHAAVEVLKSWLSRVTSGIRDDAMRANVVRALGAVVPAMGNSPALSDADTAAPEATQWSRTVYVAAHACDENGDGPSYARWEVTPAFIENLRTLQALCITHSLSEVRVIDGPDSWGPGDVAEELRFNFPELVVSQGLFWFSDQPKHRSYNVETASETIDEFAQRVCGPGEPLYLSIDRGDIDDNEPAAGDAAD